MTTFVVDSNTAIKWSVLEVHTMAARRLLEARHELLAPDLLRAELANILVKKVRIGEVSVADVPAILTGTIDTLQIVDSSSLLAGAIELALVHRQTAYDCLYLSLALARAVQFVTADQRFYRAMQRTHAASLLWVEDIPE